MQNSYAFQNYLETEVTIADPVQLVRMLYQGAIDSVSAARTCLHNRDILGRSKQISKATLILNELALNLDHSKAPELSRSLAELYDYMIRRLNEANFKQTEAPLIEVLSLLNTLGEAWGQCQVSIQPNKASDYLPATSEYHPLSYTA